MSSDTEAVTTFTLTKRIGEPATNFSVSFSNPLSPDEYATGEELELVIRNPASKEDYTRFTGIIESVDRDDADNNKIYGLSGRDKGRLLLRQPFTHTCTLTSGVDYTVEQIIDLILANTGITRGEGQTVLGEL